MKQGDQLSDGFDYTVTVADLWRSMREVEEWPMCVNHTYSSKEFLLM